MPYKFGDIVLVPFPFTNQAASKQRPAVVVSNEIYNAAKPDLVVMPITSQIRTSISLGEVWIIQWQSANLLKPSVVKPVFATLEQNLIRRQLGELNPEDQSSLRKTIPRILG